MIAPADIFKSRILIVDDQKTNVLLLEKMLRNAGYTAATSTTDSSKVCELHLLNRYDLILLDLDMPGMDGFQVMEHLKEIESGGYLPVLVVTAHREHKVRALKAGAKDFVSKPFDIAEVLIRVYNMLEVRLLYLETKQLHARLLLEKQTSARLLTEELPQSIMERLQELPEVKVDGASDVVAESWAEITVLFADVIELTKFSEGAGAAVLGDVLNEISTRFETSAGDSGLDKAAVLDDAHLATVGLPDGVANRTIGAVRKALDVTEALDRFNQHSRYKLKVRVGLDTGAGANRGKRKNMRTVDL